MKGIVDIKLTEANGKLLYHENSSNFVTDGLLEVSKNAVMSNAGKSAIHPIPQQALGGIYLFDTAIEKSASNYFNRMTNHFMAGGSQYDLDKYQNTGNDQYPRPTETMGQHLSISYDGNSCVNTWRFGTGLTGNIGAIALTKNGGENSFHPWGYGGLTMCVSPQISFVDGASISVSDFNILRITEDAEGYNIYIACRRVENHHDFLIARGKAYGPKDAWLRPDWQWKRSQSGDGAGMESVATIAVSDDIGDKLWYSIDSETGRNYAYACANTFIMDAGQAKVHAVRVDLDSMTSEDLYIPISRDLTDSYSMDTNAVIAGGYLYFTRSYDRTGLTERCVEMCAVNVYTGTHSEIIIFNGPSSEWPWYSIEIIPTHDGGVVFYKAKKASIKRYIQHMYSYYVCNGKFDKMRLIWCDDTNWAANVPVSKTLQYTAYANSSIIYIVMPTNYIGTIYNLQRPIYKEQGTMLNIAYTLTAT